jgi:hypothetical protein
MTTKNKRKKQMRMILFYCFCCSGPQYLNVSQKVTILIDSRNTNLLLNLNPLWSSWKKERRKKKADE